MADPQDRPVLTGLAALAGVGLVVGLVLGGMALVATQVLGLDGGDSSERASSGQSMYLPTPSRTSAPSDPMITLATEDPAGQESSSPTKSEEPAKELTLSAGQSAVAPMEQIDLTGVFPGGEGTILQVERFVGGEWVDFPVTASVSNETFATYVQTGQAGMNRFRVRDTDSGEVSNEVRVRVG